MPTEDLIFSPTEIATSINTAWHEFIERDQRRPVSPHTTVWASSGGTPCTRRLVLEMTVPEQRVPFSTEQLAKFRRNLDRERDLVGDMIRIGRESIPPFEVVHAQERYELKGRRGQVIVTGKVDARLRLTRMIAAPVEIKVWAPYLTERIETFDDCFSNPWTRSGGMQLLLYLYGASERFGFLLLDRAGLPLLLPVALFDYLDRVEAFLTQAEVAIAHREAGTLPDFLVGDAAECQRCPFYGGACNPPLSHPGATLLNDPELEAMLEDREVLRIPGQEFARLDKKVKDRLRGIEDGVCGAFAIHGTWGKSSRLEVPEDIKQRYTTSDPKGRFTLDIVKVA